MRALMQLFDLITNDTLTLTATGVLTMAILALLVLIAWPTRADSRGAMAAGSIARGPRAIAARTLAASGTPPAEIARRTGLSRDALALMTGMVGTPTRQKAPATARLSMLQRLRRMAGEPVGNSQVHA